MSKKQGAVLLAAAIVAAGSYGNVFGTGGNQFSIDFVDIGNANNVADTSGYGAVDHDYRIGKYEITLDQFAKARAADNRIGNGNEGYWNDGTRTVGTGGPADYVSGLEAMMFANWLTTGDAYTGAYQFNGSGTLVAVNRAAAAIYGTVYVLPTEDEWYKAAYYKPVNNGSYSLYANGSDDAASVIQGTASGWNYFYVNESPNYMWETGYGAEEQNGTYDMMGNLNELTESTNDGIFDHPIDEALVIRGGICFSSVNGLSSMKNSATNIAAEGAGFRVAAIPEPSSALLLVVGSGSILFYRRTQARQKREIPSRRHFT